MEKKIKDLVEITEIDGNEFIALTNGNTSYKADLKKLKKFFNPENVTFFDCTVNPLVVDTRGLYIFKNGTCDIDIHLTDSNFKTGEKVRFINYSDTYQVTILPYSGSSINNLNQIILDTEFSTSELLNISNKFIII